VWSGTQPNKIAAKLVKGTGGAKGNGGSVGGFGTNPAPDGSIGQALEEYQQP
jgi:hypothetical protein